MVVTRLVVERGVLGGVISSRFGGTNTKATKDRMSSRNGGTHGYPYVSQRAIQMS